MQARPTSKRFAARPVARAVAVALTVLALGACSDDDDDETPDVDTSVPGDMNPDGMNPDGMTPDGMNPDGMEPGDTDTDGMEGMDGSPEGTFVVVSNPGEGAAGITVFTPDLATQGQLLQDTANEGTAYGDDGSLFQNGDGGERVGVFRIDAENGGATPIGAGQQAGKGLEFISGENLLASCDVADAGDGGDGTADLKLYSPDSTDANAGPVATIDLPAACWDTFWDADNTRLYAALTDGRLAILDDFSSTAEGGADVDRTVTPTGDDDVQNSTNLHGVFVEDGTVLVSDVGDAASASDGQLFTFDDSDGALDGNVAATPIAGAATMLGNPVDVVLLDGAAIVAEKSNDALLVFDGVTGLSGDVAPSYSQTFTKPESIQLGTEDDVETETETDGAR